MQVFFRTFFHFAAADSLKRGLESVEHLLPCRHGAAHRLHHQRQDSGPIGGQHIRQQLVPSMAVQTRSAPARAMAASRPLGLGFPARP